MSLLPKCPDRFDKKAFWEAAYKSSSKPFEWYAEFEDLLPVLVKYARRSDCVLNIGCGNSDLGANLSSAGWGRVTNIDISEVAISKMKKQYPDADYQQMDATNMTFLDECFDVVIDKGTIDALLPKAEASNFSDTVLKVLSETMRVLKPAGRFLLVSLAQRHVLEVIKSYFENSAPCNCLIRAHHLPAPKKGDGSAPSFVLPVFVFVIMKMKMSRMTPIYELQSRPGLQLDSNIRCQNGDAWMTGVTAHQIVQYHLRTANGRFPPRQQSSEHFDVLLEFDNSHKSSVGGFRLFVVDRPVPAALKFAVFVAPCGREIDDLYSTVEGRNNLAQAISAARLIICCMVPKCQNFSANENNDKSTDQTSISLSDVTLLLNEVVIQLAPPSFDSTIDKAPYLTEAASGSGDNDINKQQLGSMILTIQDRLLSVVSVETTKSECCSSSSNVKNKSRKIPEKEKIRKIKRLTEAAFGHLTCITQICLNHSNGKKKSHFVCQQLPPSCGLCQVLGSFGKTDSSNCILQIGDDCMQIMLKMATISATTISQNNWKVFCLSEETSSDAVKSDLGISLDLTPFMYSTLEELLRCSFDAVIIMLSCAFVKSIGVFVDKMLPILRNDCKIVLVRCCREPTTDLLMCEKEIRKAFLAGKDRSHVLIDVDITDTIGDWSAAEKSETTLS